MSTSVHWKIFLLNHSIDFFVSGSFDNGLCYLYYLHLFIKFQKLAYELHFNYNISLCFLTSMIFL